MSECCFWYLCLASPIQFRLRLAAVSKDATHNTRTLCLERRKYHSDVTEWLERYTISYPQMEPYVTTLDEAQPELTALPLPSTLNEHTRASLGISSLARIERKLREGQAHDSLTDIRIAIKRYNYSLQWKKDHVFGQGPNTKAQRYLDELVEERKTAVERYERIRGEMIKLGLDPKDPTLRPIISTDDDPRKTKNMSRPAELGDSKKSDPWFWNVNCPGGLSKKEQAAWSLESKSWYFDRCKRRWLTDLVQ